MARLLRMPEVAANAVDAILAGWPVAENTAYDAGDPIATVETEKAVVDVPAEVGGVILKQLVQAGAQVNVGDPIAILGVVGEPVGNLGALLVELGAEPQLVAGAEPPADLAEVRVFSSPLARRLAKDAGIPLGQLTGSGQGGRVVRRDVDTAIDSRSRRPAFTPPPVVAGAAPYVDIPHTRARRTIAARLTESVREAPHFYLNGTAHVDKLLKMRTRINDAGSLRISVNDLVVLAAARAHVLVPAMNVIWTADAVRAFSQVDISVAVATDRGLVTPVVRGVDRMTLSGLATITADLVSRARSGTLRQDELEGGTLTITNLGVYGTADFAAIINPPQAAILAVGVAKPQPLVVKKKLRVGTQMNVTLSVDHRPIDGAIAAEWMAAFVAILEEPIRILV